jgi:hypothetical protein
MANEQETTPGVCERCDRESQHLIRQLAPDNSVHYVCWDCLRRTEKRVNLSPRFKRTRRD